MKKLVLLLLIGTVVFIAWNRNRLFFRDPLAKMTHDGIEVQSVQIFINYSNDVLLQKNSAPVYLLLVQHGEHIGMPPTLECVHFIVCMTDADVATVVPVNEGVQVESMTGKAVVFRDAGGRQSIVTLR